MNLKNSLLNRITQIAGQCGGRPCIRGMRIRVTDILEMLSENVSITEILEDFPDLELADIQACLVFAARRIDFPMPYVSDDEQAEIDKDFGSPSDYDEDKVVDMTDWVKYGGQVLQVSNYQIN
jgi:uncharacterized protein (DUF433 family)